MDQSAVQYSDTDAVTEIPQVLELYRSNRVELVVRIAIGNIGGLFTSPLGKRRFGGRVRGVFEPHHGLHVLIYRK